MEKKVDPELLAYFHHLKANLTQEHLDYLVGHPEIREILSDYLSKLLMTQPENVYAFTKFFFKYFEKASLKAELKPLVITAPSGCGKGTLITRLLKEFPHIFAQSLSHTTRAPREGEVQGFKYIFTTKEKFEEEIAQNGFLEYTQYNGNYYGTSKQAVMDVINSGKICIIEIEVQGAKNVHNSSLDCNFFFMAPPSFESLRERLVKRNTETPEKIESRLAISKKELEESASLTFFTKMVNDNFDEFYQNFHGYLKEKYPSFDFSHPQKVEENK